MPTPVLYRKQNDTTPDLVATLKYGDGTPLDIPLASIVVIRKRPKRGGATVVLGGAGTIEEGGVVRYAWATNDLATAGDFWLEIEVTLPSGKKQTTPPDSYIDLRVTPVL